MTKEQAQRTSPRRSPYLTAAGAWALAFGCSVGWGSFVMPGSTFLPLAGPVGSALGIGLGAVIMLLIAANYHFLMNRFPDAGGTYTYTKKCFGYDHGFLSAWFLILTYIAIIWANATALPLIARTLMGSTFQFGFHYEIAGYHVYMGEMLLAIGALLFSVVICLNRKAAERIQILLAVLLILGVVICFAAAMASTDVKAPFEPAFSGQHSAAGGTFTVFALAPWAYVGFESISHSAGEARFSLRKGFRIMAVALFFAALAYILLALLAVTALPEGCASWPEYIASYGSYSGLASQPTFYAANRALGGAGNVLLGTAALCGMLTGLIGHLVALSRLLAALSEDGLLPEGLGRLDANQVPRRAILCIFLISVVLPFFGRTAISWIVDVTTVGATIAYAFASASAWKEARQCGSRLYTVTGMAGIIVSLLFALEFLIPNIVSVTTLSTESYLILAAWGILGFAFFRHILKRDRNNRLGRSTVAWIVLLGLVIFTSGVWMRQSTETVLEKSAAPISGYCAEEIARSAGRTAEAVTESLQGGVAGMLERVSRTVGLSMAIQIGLIVISLLFMFDIYRQTQKRERKTEIEKALAEDANRAKTSFLSNMSHEIRTPMNAIIGLDSIALRNPNLQPQTREQLEKIGASARHLLGLINDILDMSRIESGRMVLKREEFSFREFLDQINIMINGQCVDKGLQYECVINGHVRDYYIGDDMKLKQVLINILGNSVKFTNAPGSVTLMVEPLETDGERASGEEGAGAEKLCTLRFRMTDTGIGMDPEYIPKIFEAFSQEDATATNRYGGSGLGMAITKNFVEMMGGEIQVKSQKGVGSEFTVTVQLGRSDRTFRLEDGISIPPGLTAAVVDDDEVSCEHAVMVLGLLGIRADGFTTGEEALRAMRGAMEQGAPYRLMLTDFRMPGMNGLDLTRALRTFDGGETAVIMLTGYNWDIIEEEALSEGIDGIMAKPLYADNLMREIHAVLVRREGGEAAAAVLEETKEKDLAGRMVLMAEDVDQNAEILEDLLALEGMKSERAVNGEDAVRLFEERPEGYYDAILMDLRMPVMDGLAATRAIRELERPDAGTIPIVAMTANVFDEDVARSLEAGMDAHLAKPVEPERLYETLDLVFRKGRNLS